MQLILFDIDGTLLLNGTVVNDIFLETFERVCGRPPVIDRFSFAGLTDRRIFQMLLEGVEVDEDPQSLYARFAVQYPLALNQIWRLSTSTLSTPRTSQSPRVIWFFTWPVTPS